MSKQVLIIGLGQLGLSLAKTLSEKGMEVIAVDINKDIVDKTAVFIDDAVCLDATDESSLEKLSPREKDIIICTIGSKEPSILQR